MKRRSATPLASAAGLLLVLAAAYGLDLWVGRAQRLTMAAFTLAPATTTAVAANLILALLWLALLWLALRAARQSRLLPLVYLASGALVLGVALTAVRGWLPAVLYRVAGPATRVGMTGAVYAAIGIGLMVLKLKVE